MIEMVEIPKIKKLNYLILLSDKIKKDNKDQKIPLWFDNLRNSLSTELGIIMLKDELLFNKTLNKPTPIKSILNMTGTD